jgi:hypothetical protein
MEPQPLGAFYGRSWTTRRLSQARLGEVIALVGISFALAIFFAAGEWASTGQLVVGWRCEIKVDICEQLTKEPDPHHDGGDPKTPPKLRLSRFRNCENVEVCLVEKWNRTEEAHRGTKSLVQ